MKQITEIDCYCDQCKQVTHHSIHGHEKNVYTDEHDEYYAESNFYIVKCKGCDNVSFLQVNDGDEYMQYNEYGDMDHVPEYITYPKRQGYIEPLSSWDMPAIISRIYKESVTALNQGCDILAAIGFRTTVEAICKEKGITTGKLATKINKLKEKGIITKADCERLHQARFMGNESTHEMVAPERPQLLLVLEVINNILNNLYIIDKKCRETFEYRFENQADFLQKLSEGVNRCHTGDTYTIYGFLPEDYKYRKVDIDKYEAELISLIDSGEYTELTKCPPVDGIRQMYSKV